ncbi:MAG: hypothetical protein K2X90_04155 [Candidatus Babeliaceae bacterium]|nr:hypothetical protein [Candidatus Babeliaceae bacterium]
MKRLLLTFISLLALNDLVYAQKINKEALLTLTSPIVFTRIGLESFFVDQFSSPLYTECVLPSHFGHLAYLLHYSSNVEDPYDFVLGIFDIFHTRMKDCHWVNALSFSLLLDQLPAYLQDMCVQKEQEELEKSIEDIIYKRLFARFTKLSNNPMDGVNAIDTLLETIDQVVKPTAQEISQMLTKSAEKRPVRELQEIVTRFIESALEKIVWNPQTQHDSWDSLCILAEQIRLLHDQGIIYSTKTLNHLYWTLLYRYGYFLRSTKDMLNPEVFEYIKADIMMHQYDWLASPEAEEFLTPKKEYLKYILWECIADQQAQAIL